MRNVTATVVSTTQITLIWDSDFSGIPAEVQWNLNSAGSYPGANSMDTRGRQVWVSGLTASTTYDFRVRQCTASDNCSNWVGATATTDALDIDPPQVPGAFHVAISGVGQVTLTWRAPRSDGGSPVTSYDYRQKAGAGTYGTAMDVGNVLTRTVSGLAPSTPTDYTFQVRARNSAGAGDWSQEITVNIKPAESTLTAPPGFQATAHSVIGAAYLDWNDQPSAEPTVAYYEYQYRLTAGSNTDWSDRVRVFSASRRAKVFGLSLNTEYAFRLRAVSEQQFGPWTSEARVTTPKAKIYLYGATATEGDPLEFRLCTTARYHEDIRFSFETAQGSATSGDFSSRSDQVTLPANVSCITLPGVPTMDDLEDEETEFMFMRISPVDAIPAAVTVENNRAQGRIIDND